MEVASVSTTSTRLLYLVGFVDLFAVSLIIPSLPAFIKSMDSGPLMVGFVTSMYGGIQLFSSPIAGSCSDMYGRRNVLLASVLGAFVGCMILGFSTSIWMVLVSRIPCGLFKHTADTMKLCVADNCPLQLRSSTLGKLNAFSSLGFMIGPALGGYVSSLPNGFRATACITASLFLINYAIIYFFLPATTANKAPMGKVDDLECEKSLIQEKADDRLNVAELFWGVVGKFRHWKSYFVTSSPTRSVLIIRMLLGIAVIIFRTNFMLVLEEKFKAGSESRGFILSYMGFVTMCGSFLVGPLVKWVGSEVVLLQVAMVSLTVSYSLTGVVVTVKQLLILLIPQLLSVSILRACTTSLLSKFVRSDLLGGVLGASASLTSVARVFAPMISGLLMEQHVDAPAFCGAAISATCALLFWSSIYSTRQVQHIVEEKLT